MTPGIYHLVLRVPRRRAIQVGRLGSIEFPAGYYVYTGSALNGLESRLARHRRRRKKLRWHIDYLLQAAEIAAAVEVPTRRRLECARNRRVLAAAGARVVARGFGAGGCQCEAHLAYFGDVCPEPLSSWAGRRP